MLKYENECILDFITKQPSALINWDKGLYTTYVTGFGKIKYFVTFDTYGQNNALYSTSQPYSEYRVSVYAELPVNLWNILIGTYGVATH